MDALQTILNEVAERSAAAPEAVSVRVCPPAHRPISEDDARAVGPDLARALYPSRRFRSVLHVEASEAGCFDVAVEVV